MSKALKINNLTGAMKRISTVSEEVKIGPFLKQIRNYFRVGRKTVNTASDMWEFSAGGPWMRFGIQETYPQPFRVLGKS
jgi:hypothetical protein